MENLLPELVRC